MEFSDWSVIAEIVSAIGVIISLIYLSFQVRNNTKALRIEAHKELRSEFLHYLDDCTSTKEKAEIWQRGLDQFNKMSSVDQALFHSLMHPLTHGLHSLWESNKVGVIGEGDLIATRNIFIALILTPGGQQWWESFKHMPPPLIVNYIENGKKDLKKELRSAYELMPWLRLEQ